MVNPHGGSGEKQGRDGACTPKWLADLLGEFDLDPASNERSKIRSAIACIPDSGGDGLIEYDPGDFDGRRKTPGGGGVLVKGTALYFWFVFCNPPYARGQVIRWIRHYRHTRFCFLLRWDPSTAWFSELLPHCTHVWFPNERIEFEPPPGVEFSSNPFPHALFLRDPPADRLARLATRGYVFPVDSGLLRAQSDSHEHHASDSGPERDCEAGGADREAQGGDPRPPREQLRFVFPEADHPG